MKTSLAKLDNDKKIQTQAYASVQPSILHNVTSVIQQKKRGAATNRLDVPPSAGVAKDSSIFGRESAAWTGALFEQLINGRTFQGTNETYTWKVAANTPEMLSNLMALVNVAYGDISGNADARRKKLSEHQLLLTVTNSKGELVVFIPVKRNQFGWKTSLFGCTNRLVASVCLKDFCAFVGEHQHQLPYTMQVSRKLANAMFKLADDLPIVPFSEIEKIKQGNVIKPTASQVQEAIATRCIPDTEAARNNVYLTKISLGSTPEQIEYKIMIGNPIIANATDYRNKILAEFVRHPLWMMWCSQLFDTPRSGYAHLGYTGKDVVNLYDHSKRVGKVACLLGKKQKLDLDLIHVMAGIHDFAEVFTGDYVSGSVDASEKYTQERCAWEDNIVQALGEDGWKLYQIWLMYETQNSAEAQLIWQVDKLEPLIEAIEFFNIHPEYAAQRHSVIKTIMANVASKITHPPLIKVLRKLQEDEVAQNNFTFETYCQWLAE